MVSGQSINPGRFSLAGAVDLEGVKRRVEAKAKQEAAVRAGSASGDNVAKPVAGGYTIDVNEQSFQSMVQTSVSFPILMLIWSAQDTTAYPMVAMLAQAVDALKGRLQFARIDADESPAIAQALGAQTLPSLYGLIGGRPMPILQGIASDDELQSICDRILPQLIQLAGQSGVSGVAPYVQPSLSQSQQTDDDAQQGIPQSHQKAYELVQQGDYAAAATEYGRLAELDPTDTLAKRERSKALLLGRNVETNVAAVRQAAGDCPEDVQAQLAVADVDMIDGHCEDAFARLLDFIASGHADDVAVVRDRLLEYFAMLPSDDERLKRARRRLAALLF